MGQPGRGYSGGTFHCVEGALLSNHLGGSAEYRRRACAAFRVGLHTNVSSGRLTLEDLHHDRGITWLATTRGDVRTRCYLSISPGGLTLTGSVDCQIAAFTSKAFACSWSQRYRVECVLSAHLPVVICILGEIADIVLILYVSQLVQANLKPFRRGGVLHKHTPWQF